MIPFLLLLKCTVFLVCNYTSCDYIIFLLRLRWLRSNLWKVRKRKVVFFNLDESHTVNRLITRLMVFWIGGTFRQLRDKSQETANRTDRRKFDWKSCTSMCTSVSCVILICVCVRSERRRSLSTGSVHPVLSLTKLNAKCEIKYVKR